MASALEIIARSIADHPTLFRASLVSQAETHDDYVTLRPNSPGARGAIASRDACLRAYDAIGRDDLAPNERAAMICRRCGDMVISLNVAAKMQELSPAVRTAAAVDWQEIQDRADSELLRELGA